MAVMSQLPQVLLWGLLDFAFLLKGCFLMMGDYVATCQLPTFLVTLTAIWKSWTPCAESGAFEL